MNGPTHVLGGVAAVAAFTLATGHPEAMPAWAFAVGAISALVPDADNHNGTMLNRPHLLPAKLLTYPLWTRASHRGRTHSLVGIAAFAALVLALWSILGWATHRVGDGSGDLAVLLTSAVAGYASHLILDLPNRKPLQLFWPLPGRYNFPPGRALHFLRFDVGSMRSHYLVHLPLVIFLGWFAVSHGAGILQNTWADGRMIQELGAGLLKVIAALVGLIAGVLS